MDHFGNIKKKLGKIEFSLISGTNGHFTIVCENLSSAHSDYNESFFHWGSTSSVILEAFTYDVIDEEMYVCFRFIYSDMCVDSGRTRI